MLDIYHHDVWVLSDIMEPGPSRSSVISDYLRPDSSDQPWSSGTRAEVAFFTENNDTINLWSSCDEDSGPVYSFVSLEEPSPSDDDYDDVGTWKGFRKKISKMAPFA